MVQVQEQVLQSQVQVQVLKVQVQVPVQVLKVAYLYLLVEYLVQVSVFVSNHWKCRQCLLCIWDQMQVEFEDGCGTIRVSVGLGLWLR